jgi:hypothetical protein
MIDAMLLMNGTTVFSPWFPRQADMLRVVAECVAVEGVILEIELFAKNSSETGDGEPVEEGTSIILNAPGRSAAVEWRTMPSQEGVGQLLRFRYKVIAEESPGWILFRILPACWFDAVVTI